jgi:hypothetical protein
MISQRFLILTTSSRLYGLAYVPRPSPPSLPSPPPLLRIHRNTPVDPNTLAYANSTICDLLVCKHYLADTASRCPYLLS